MTSFMRGFPLRDELIRARVTCTGRTSQLAHVAVSVEIALNVAIVKGAGHGIHLNRCARACHHDS